METALLLQAVRQAAAQGAEGWIVGAGDGGDSCQPLKAGKVRSREGTSRARCGGLVSGVSRPASSPNDLWPAHHAMNGAQAPAAASWAA